MRWRLCMCDDVWYMFSPSVQRHLHLHTPPNSTQILRIFRSVLRADSETASDIVAARAWLFCWLLDCAATAAKIHFLSSKLVTSSVIRGKRRLRWLCSVDVVHNTHKLILPSIFPFSKNVKKVKNSSLFRYVTLLKKTELPLLLPTVGSLVCI